MRENPLLVKREIKLRRIKNGSAWLDMRQAWAIWLKRNVREADINLNEEGKAHDNAIQLDIRES